jgi:hypothetical protein
VGHFLARYFGNDLTRVILGDIQEISDGYFTGFTAISSVAFEAGSRVSVLGEFAFCDCS